ncbi:MAG: secretin N-terminal domain-containing protein [Rubripirellula sp.]
MSLSLRMLLAFFVICITANFAIAQRPQAMVIGPDGKPMAVGQPGSPPTRRPDSSKSEKKPGDEDGEKDESKESKGADSPEPKVIRRGDQTDETEADPEELKAMVGEDGRVAFQFRNQPWVELVQWLADISDQPLDWLELPGDRVNMRSPGRYTVEETRDLFNRYLLARGYTLLEIDGGLTVAKTKEINPAIVPRVDALALSSLQPHTFVRTSLDVGWLSAEKLAQELAPMISANGRLTALTTTNRIEAMDAAINLDQIAELLDQESNPASLESLAPEFKLRYLPAEEAKRMLEQFLGVQKKESAPLTPQQIQMMQQQMRQQNKGAPPTEKKVEVSIVANPRQNSVIIRAPADRVAIAMEFLKRVDVPSGSIVSLADIQSRVQVFRLESLDPEKLIEIVSEMNVLEPTTRVRVDKDNNALIVSGSAADRFVIDSLIKRLDGSGRSFEVLPLRRLDPAEVAESISFLMGKKDKDDKSSSNRRSYYYGYYGGGEDQKKETDEFRVAANTRYRQVLLWANEHEMEQVRSLLIKLGELPPPGGSQKSVRIIDASATPETFEYLQRLKQQWNRLSPNPLELPDKSQFKDPNISPISTDPEDSDESEPDEKAPSKQPSDQDVAEDSLATNSLESGYRFTLMQQSSETTDRDSTAEPPPVINSARDFDRAFQQPKPSPVPPEGNRAPSPVRVEIDRSGNLILISPDTQALDQLENLMLQIAPPKRPYHVFHIEHASASWMRINLEDYFKDMEEEDSGSDDFYRWYWGNDDEDDKDEPSGLGKGAKLRFVDDLDTNTLVVNGASTDQLRTISELIELWDVPEPVNKRKTRFTRLVVVKYGKADKISETVKEAYRDLLSSNDKAFSSGGKRQNGGAGGGGSDAPKSREGNGSGLQDSESGRDAGGADFSFKGKLSIGIDDVGNTLLVSAEGEPLLELVADMIDQLDQAARPTGEVQILKLPGGLSSQSLQDALRPISETGGATDQRPGRNARPSPKPDKPAAVSE